jgi:hypothetical protein
VCLHTIHTLLHTPCVYTHHTHTTTHHTHAVCPHTPYTHYYTHHVSRHTIHTPYTHYYTRRLSTHTTTHTVCLDTPYTHYYTHHVSRHAVCPMVRVCMCPRLSLFLYRGCVCAWARASLSSSIVGACVHGPAPLSLPLSWVRVSMGPRGSVSVPSGHAGAVIERGREGGREGERERERERVYWRQARCGRAT